MMVTCRVPRRGWAYGPQCKLIYRREHVRLPSRRVTSDCEQMPGNSGSGRPRGHFCVERAEGKIDMSY